MQKVLLLILAFKTSVMLAQISGNSPYPFLNLQTHATTGGLGGYAIATPETDLGLVYQNPSLLNKHFHKQISLSYLNYMSDISAGNFSFALNIPKHKLTAAAGIQYFSYGNFERTLEDGGVTGTFSAGDYCFFGSFAKPLSNHFTYGSTLKFIYSSLSSFTSLGLAIDGAITYKSNDSLFTASAVLSNLGSQITSYTASGNQLVQPNLQIGFTKKFAHNPLRVGLVAHNLQNPGGLLYQIANRNNQNISLETGLPIEEQFSVLEHVMSHLVFNTEVVLGKSLRLRVGYNYLRRRELGITDFAGSTGFSWGFGLKLSKFFINYGSANYHLGNSSNQFSILTNLSDFSRNK